MSQATTSLPSVRAARWEFVVRQSGMPERKRCLALSFDIHSFQWLSARVVGNQEAAAGGHAGSMPTPLISGAASATQAEVRVQVPGEPPLHAQAQFPSDANTSSVDRDLGRPMDTGEEPVGATGNGPHIPPSLATSSDTPRHGHAAGTDSGSSPAVQGGEAGGGTSVIVRDERLGGAYGQAISAAPSTSASVYHAGTGGLPSGMSSGTVASEFSSTTTISLQELVQSKGELLSRPPGKRLELLGTDTSLHLCMFVKIARGSFYVGALVESGHSEVQLVLFQPETSTASASSSVLWAGADGASAKQVLTQLWNNSALLTVQGNSGPNFILAEIGNKSVPVFLCRITMGRGAHGRYWVDSAHLGSRAVLPNLVALREVSAAECVQGRTENGEEEEEEGHSTKRARRKPGAQRGDAVGDIRDRMDGAAMEASGGPAKASTLVTNLPTRNATADGHHPILGSRHAEELFFKEACSMSMLLRRVLRLRPDEQLPADFEGISLNTVVNAIGIFQDPSFRLIADDPNYSSQLHGRSRLTMNMTSDINPADMDFFQLELFILASHKGTASEQARRNSTVGVSPHVKAPLGTPPAPSVAQGTATGGGAQAVGGSGSGQQQGKLTRTIDLFPIPTVDAAASIARECKARLEQGPPGDAELLKRTIYFHGVDKLVWPSAKAGTNVGGEKTAGLQWASFSTGLQHVLEAPLRLYFGFDPHGEKTDDVAKKIEEVVWVCIEAVYIAASSTVSTARERLGLLKQRQNEPGGVFRSGVTLNVPCGILLVSTIIRAFASTPGSWVQRIRVESFAQKERYNYSVPVCTLPELLQGGDVASRELADKAGHRLFAQLKGCSFGSLVRSLSTLTSAPAQAPLSNSDGKIALGGGLTARLSMGIGTQVSGVTCGGRPMFVNLASDSPVAGRAAHAAQSGPGPQAAWGVGGAARPGTEMDVSVGSAMDHDEELDRVMSAYDIDTELGEGEGGSTEKVKVTCNAFEKGFRESFCMGGLPPQLAPWVLLERFGKTSSAAQRTRACLVSGAAMRGSGAGGGRGAVGAPAAAGPGLAAMQEDHDHHDLEEENRCTRVMRIQTYNTAFARCLDNETRRPFQISWQLWDKVAMDVGQRRRLDLADLRTKLGIFLRQSQYLLSSIGKQGAGARMEVTFLCDPSLLHTWLFPDSLAGQGGAAGEGAVNTSPSGREEKGLSVMKAMVAFVLDQVKARVQVWDAQPIALFSQLLVAVHTRIYSVCLDVLSRSGLPEGEREATYWTMCGSASFLSCFYSGSSVLKSWQLWPSLSVSAGRVGSLLRHMPEQVKRELERLRVEGGEPAPTALLASNSSSVGDTSSSTPSAGAPLATSLSPLANAAPAPPAPAPPAPAPPAPAPSAINSVPITVMAKPHALPASGPASIAIAKNESEFRTRRADDIAHFEKNHCVCSVCGELCRTKDELHAHIRKFEHEAAGSNERTVDCTGSLLAELLSAPAGMDSSQVKAFDAIVKEGQCTAMLGAAGSGKSVVLMHAYRSLCTLLGPEAVMLCASTGAAAQRLESALGTGRVGTLHSALGVRPDFDHGTLPKTVQRLTERKRIQLKGLKALMLDEASMTSAEMFLCMDALLRAIRGNSSLFGGVQLVVCGDVMQLLAFDRKKNDRVEQFYECILMERYFVVVLLQRNHRQSGSDNAPFVQLLTNVRLGGFSLGNYRKLALENGWGKDVEKALSTLQWTDEHTPVAALTAKVGGAGPPMPELQGAVAASHMSATSTRVDASVSGAVGSLAKALALARPAVHGSTSSTIAGGAAAADDIGQYSDILAHLADERFAWMNVVHLFRRTERVCQKNNECLGLYVDRRMKAAGEEQRMRFVKHAIPIQDSPYGSRPFRAGEESEMYPELLEKSGVLNLALGVPVMLLVNHTSAGYFNGSRAYVVGMDWIDDRCSVISVLVEQGNGTRRLCKVERVLCKTRDLQAPFLQFPMQLAFASTVHKAQGLEFALAKVQLSGLVPEKGWSNIGGGLLYTAMSRVKSGRGLLLDYSHLGDCADIDTLSWSQLADAISLRFIMSLEDRSFYKKREAAMQLERPVAHFVDIVAWSRPSKTDAGVAGRTSRPKDPIPKRRRRGEEKD